MKNYKHIKHIFFDLDHTLWDFDKNSEMAFRQIFLKDFPEIDLHSFIKVYVPINQAVWKLYQRDEITNEQLRYMRLKKSFEAININVSDFQIDEIANEYIRLLPENNHLFDGTIEILDYLKTNYSLHIITNGFAEVQDKKIKNSGISGYFKTITNSENAGAKKPNSIIYNYALAVANAKKETSVMIGDCIDADILGALNFGIEAIFVNYNKNHLQQDVHQINHLLELKNHF